MRYTLLIAAGLALSRGLVAQEPARGVVTGQVMDQGTARPISFAMIDLVGTTMGAQADLDGRYRVANVPAGTYRVRARRIGFVPGVSDSLRLVGGQTLVQNFTLASAATQLEAARVTAAANNANSDAALIALQKAAPAVMDGISAQAIARAPGSNAAEAIVRVTGISVVDKKFTIVRGLPERYSNTLLNNVELPSPEPLRKVVPLDVFPASLLESIVALKTATPDRPGDFAGGSVEIKTKEFPERRVVQFNISQDWNSLTTFKDVAYVRSSPRAWVGFGGDGRSMPPLPPSGGTASGDAVERFAESLRNVWTPTPRAAPPGLGFGFSVGDRIGGGSLPPLGYTVSLAYSSRLELNPGRLYQFVHDPELGAAQRGFVARENQSIVDWGATANFSLLAAPSHKLGWKNLYTRNAEEMISVSDGFDTDRGLQRGRTYQVRYIERELLQTQLTGDHVFAPLLNSRIEWKATLARAARDEPDNRSATYIEDVNTGLFSLQANVQNNLWFRFLDDVVAAGHLDWSLPVRIWGGRELLFKTGGMYRDKTRDFRAQLYSYRPALTPPSGPETLTLAPEQAFAPEHVGSEGSDITLFKLDAQALPYRSSDDLSAAYAMIDFPLLSRLRIVGGARAEQWRLDIHPASGTASIDGITSRRELDVLPSVNLTLALSDRFNVRLAGYQTLARPDPRELSGDYYQAVTGECANEGDTLLVHTRIQNADFRVEFYPSGDELFALSAFYKHFRDPVIEALFIPQSTNCVVRYKNAESATVYGGELEMRKSLAFLPLIPEGFSAGLNFTLVQTQAQLGENFSGVTTRFMGQSPFVTNANLTYARPDNQLMASVMAHAYGERITRYGAIQDVAGQFKQIPDVIEQPRVIVDAKVQWNASRRMTVSLAGKNITDTPQRFYQKHNAGRVQTGFVRSGASIKLGAGYEW